MADRCLYGVDINPMAVEMAKLSLWLITLQRDRPFTFLDHALKCGDSLLGVSSVKQIENFSLRPGERQVTFATANLFRYVEEASAKRRALEDLPSNDHTQIETKNRLHAEAEAATAKVKALADCLIAFELRGLDGDAYEEQRAVPLTTPNWRCENRCRTFQAYAREQLRGRRPFHWAVEFPEVLHAAVSMLCGNPPFLWGNRISTRLGDEYRDWLLNLHKGAVGNADLCVHFFRRAKALTSGGVVGLLATNSIGETDNRTSGLVRLLEEGCVIFFAISDMPWPGVAGLHVSLICLHTRTFAGDKILDGRPVTNISSFLDEGLSGYDAEALSSNAEIAFKGVDTGGMGFVLSDAEASEVLKNFPQSQAIVWPLLNGDDFLGQPDQSASRRLINFTGMSEQEAARHVYLYKLAYQRVKPYRQSVKSKSERLKWWLYNRPRPEMYAAIAGLQQVLANCVVSKYICFDFVAARTVFTNALNIWATDRFEWFAVLQSTIHDIWARQYGSTLETRNRYNVTDCFETFPLPEKIEPLSRIGQDYYRNRKALMRVRNEGLTDTYNRFHDWEKKSEDIVRLRALHVAMDQAVVAAYGWCESNWAYGFYETKQGKRSAISAKPLATHDPRPNSWL